MQMVKVVAGAGVVRLMLIVRWAWLGIVTLWRSPGPAAKREKG
jgi:hypothetical protein